MKYPSVEKAIARSYEGRRLVAGDTLIGYLEAQHAAVGIRSDYGALSVATTYTLTPIEAERFAKYLLKRAAAARAYNRKKK